MKNNQLDWIKRASANEKVFVRMVVGWQRVAVALNATIGAFNSEFFQKSDNPMKLISAKMMVVAALQEIRDLLNKWQGELRKNNAANRSTDVLRGDVRSTLDKIDTFREVRNLVYHFADPISSEVKDPDDLVKVYEEIEGYDLDELNGMLRTLVQVGEQMKQDTLQTIENLK